VDQDRRRLHVVDAQPAMAPLFHLASAVLDAIAEAGNEARARRSAAAAAERFGASLEDRTRRAGERTASHLPEKGAVLTLSSSSTVEGALIARAEEGGLRVVCLESRPMREGRLLARALADAGLPVTYAVDAASGALVREVDLVLMGADSIGDAGVVNKIGSALLAREAHRCGVPVVVAADSTKLLPPGFPQPLRDDRPAADVWTPPEGVTVWNRYFEVVDAGDVSLIVTESEAMSPAACGAARGRLSVPPELSRWARSRRGVVDVPPR
jgi:translation initiation factor 2B subunit (eIF-2B alpha/beta/delta family)